jgi:HK97 gp10 family phage protein
MSEITFQGLDDITEKLDSLMDAANVKAALGKACAIVERTAKQKAPKGNGELRRSITSKVDEVGGDIAGIVFTPLLYAPYVEYGTGLFAEEGGRQDVPWHYQDDEGEWHTTSGMKPSPYMRPALYENREQIKRILGEAILND